MRCVSMEPARPRAAVPNFSGLTACELRIIYDGRLSPHDLKKPLEETVVTAENDLKLLREILGADLTLGRSRCDARVVQPGPEPHGP
jgi:hypothetical protein